jgi:hypothetical protein
MVPAISAMSVLLRRVPRRVHAMQGDTAKAKATYQDSFTLWKDADTDVLT